jgi:hypothetical protein
VQIRRYHSLTGFWGRTASMSVMAMLRQVCSRWRSALRLLNSIIGGSKLSLSLGVRDGTGFYRFHCPGFDRRRTIGRPDGVSGFQASSASIFPSTLRFAAASPVLHRLQRSRWRQERRNPLTHPQGFRITILQKPCPAGSFTWTVTFHLPIVYGEKKEGA